MPLVFSKLRMLTDFIASYFIPNYKYDYWHCPHKHSSYIDQGDYFIDFIPKTQYPGPFDDQGIPLLELSSQHWSHHHDTVYAPIVISQYALGTYACYLRKKNPSDLSLFLHIANWLIKFSTSEESNGLSLCVLYADYGHGKARSGMAQGLAISIWCRAFVETQNQEYLQKAHEVFNSFTLDIDEGGVVEHIGYPILQEWVNERIHILNGHLFAFAGIVDLLRVELDETERDRLKTFYDLYLASSLKMITESDIRFWTRYSLRPSIIPNIASYFYHDLHIEMLQGLRDLIGIHDFDPWITRWKLQQNKSLYRLAAMIMKLIDRMYTGWVSRTGRLPA